MDADDRTNGRVQIPFDTIVKANLELDVDQEFKRAQGVHDFKI